MDLIMYTYLYYIRIFLQIFSLRSIMHASSPVFLTLPSLYIIGPISSYSIYTISQHKKCRINKKKEHQRWNLKQLTKKNVLLMRHPIHKKKKKMSTYQDSIEWNLIPLCIYIYIHTLLCVYRPTLSNASSSSWWIEKEKYTFLDYLFLASSFNSSASSSPDKKGAENFLNSNRFETTFFLLLLFTFF